MSAALLAASPGRSDQQPASPPPLPQFEHLAPFQAIANVATQGAQMSVAGIASPPTRSQLQVGDTVTALASIYKDREFRQWIIELKVVEPRPPLSITAGVIGLAVTRPEGGPRLTIQIISAKCGEGSKEGAPKP